MFARAENKKNINQNFPKILGLTAILSLAVAVVTVFVFHLNRPTIKIETTNLPPVNQEVTKPVILSNNLPPEDREFEELGDKLAQASVCLRDRRPETALVIINDVESRVATKNAANHREMYRLIKTESSKLRSELQQGKIKEANQEIDRLLNQLDAAPN